MHLTPEMLEAAYELVRTTPPFKGWHLPAGEEVEFFLSRHRHNAADCQQTNGRWRIRVSAHYTGNLDTLLRYMMHEMVHIAQGIKCPSEKAEHGRDFKTRARLVCRVHHIDPKTF